MVPPGRDLAPIEKLLQPFSKKFWILLVSFVAVTFGALVLIDFKFKSFNKSIFGSGSPFFSLISVTLAVSITSLPQKSPGRIIFMSLVIFALVLQAVYQGALFKFLQADTKIKEAQTIDEMIEMDFKFYSIGSTDDLFEGNKRIMQRFIESH